MKIFRKGRYQKYLPFFYFLGIITQNIIFRILNLRIILKVKDNSKNTKSVFLCNECGYSVSKWLGKCPDCGSWNSFIETSQSTNNNSNNNKKFFDGNLNKNNSPISLDQVSKEHLARFSTGIQEFDRILGGGIVNGSFILLGGAPGIGKSTLVLQMSKSSDKKILYVSGEESATQIKTRANRLNINSDKIFLLPTDNLTDIENSVNEINPEILIIDSIQTIYNPELLNAVGTVSQIKDVASQLLRLCKTKNITIFLIGHITKDGSLAGPKILEHIVDVVLYFEDDKGIYRIIRSFKNRFGNTSEISVFEMTSDGLIEVNEPDKIFYDDETFSSSGSVLSAIMEGTRALTVELQALVTKTPQELCRRQATGLDINRIFFLIAVLEKKLKINFYNQDIFLNVVGGLKIKDIAIDMAVCASIISSYFDIIIPKEIVFLGEVGLGGEIRTVSFMQERIKRISSFGIKQLVTANVKNIKTEDIQKFEKSKKIEIIYINNVQELLKFVQQFR